MRCTFGGFGCEAEFWSGCRLRAAACSTCVTAVVLTGTESVYAFSLTGMDSPPLRTQSILMSLPTCPRVCVCVRHCWSCIHFSRCHAHKP